jgi:hypothetical protein
MHLEEPVRRVVRNALLLAGIAVIGLNADAAPVTLDFEGFSDSTALSTQYPGLTFTDAIILTAGISLNEFELPPHSGGNVVSDNGGPMTIDFSAPITTFAGYFTYLEPLTIYAFNTGKIQVAMATSAYSSNDALFGDPGSSPNEFIQVSFTSGISSITITSDPAGGSFTMDDATFASATTTVPEPTTTFELLITAFVLVSVRRWIPPRVMMKKTILFSSLFILAAAGLYAFQQPPIVTIAVATPSTIYANSTTTVSITAQIPDSRVIVNGVTLLQVDPITGAQSVVGTLAPRGGGTFSITIQPQSSAPQLFVYELSAPFRGLLKRSISLPITVAVAPVGVVLPPDPGPAGMQTLSGIDSDGDGVRDDIQRWIAVTQPNSARNRAALTQAARGIQAAILADNPSQANSALDTEENGDICLTGIMGDTLSSGNITDNLDTIALNTTARTKAYLTANSLVSGTAVSVPTVASRTSLCSFNPALLPD